MILKIGRHNYEITEDDVFMDNGRCVQLLSQSKLKSDYGRKPNPLLSKAAIKNINSFEHIERPYNSVIGGVKVFSLNLGGGV